MLYMLSTNANAGTENLSVTFDISTDPDIDQVNVQNRVSQALSSLPTDVSQYGVTVRQSTGSPMMLISLYSPNKSYDSLFRASAMSPFLGPRNTRCASGSSRTCWPSWGYP